jgi:hypothetical protein
MGAQEFVTFMIPTPAHSARVRVEEVEARGGRAFEVRDGERRDVLLVGEVGAGETPLVASVEASLIASDFEWAWLRFALDSSVPEEMLLVGGRRLSLDGQEVVSGARRLTYVTARREGGSLRVGTDAGESFKVSLQSPAMTR